MEADNTMSMCYMGCQVTKEFIGSGRTGTWYWIIRDMAWGGKIVAKFTEREFFASDRGVYTVNENEIIRDWCQKKQNDPAWEAYARTREIANAIDVLE